MFTGVAAFFACIGIFGGKITLCCEGAKFQNKNVKRV